MKMEKKQLKGRSWKDRTAVASPEVKLQNSVREANVMAVRMMAME